MMKTISTDSKSPVKRWYFSTGILVTGGIFLAGLAYGIVMQCQLKKTEAEASQLKLTLEQEKKSTQQAQELRMAKQTMPEYLHRRLEMKMDYVTRNDRVLEENRNSVKKLSELDTVKEYLNSKESLLKMKEESKALYQLFEKKRARYKELQKKAQEG